MRCLKFLFTSLALLSAITACTVVAPGLGRTHYGPVQPVVAVTDFQNRSGFKGNWDLGSGMAEILISELMDSKEVVVLERKYINDVLGEIVRQGKELFRKEGRVERGRLKNAQYLIRGVVSNFHVSGDKSGWFAVRSARLFALGNSAKVTLQVYVVDVETGEIIGTSETSGKARAFGFGGSGKYKEIAFGGQAYFKTPLGKATRKAMNRAVDQILDTVPQREWQGRIASGGVNEVVINGGRNVRIKPGDRLLVRGRGRVVTDPITGNALNELSGPVVGKIEILEVEETYSRARVLEGAPERGQILEPVAR